MRVTYLYIWIIALFFSCQSLDLNPLSQGSSETWNSTPEELEMSVNDLYKLVFWKKDNDDWTDDWMFREVLTPITDATINSQTAFVSTWWKETYKAIARANTILENVDRLSSKLSEKQINRYVAEARFTRASMYALLIARFGNVVYTEQTLDISEALEMEQVKPELLLQKVYEDYDFAALHLEEEYPSNAVQRATKGAALALKARFALYMGDFETAATAAKACMDLGQYSLHSDFADLFLSKTKRSGESIFVLPRSIALKVTKGSMQEYISRNAGGWAQAVPSWDLLYAFTDSEGKPIDESTIFDPADPFANRDPRCAQTIVAFGTPHLDFVYDVHPNALTTLKISTNQMVTNNDNRVNAPYASFNGLIWKKGVDEDWLRNSYVIEPDHILIRYAEVLLIYAEAKIELNQIDQSVLNAINEVRARAYKVAVNSESYPKVTSTSQSALRKILRTERRMEFALEGLRYMDIIRWKVAGTVLNKPNYGMLDPADLLEKVVNKGKWFLPSAPPIDDNGSPDFTAFYNQGLIKLISIRKFDESRQYLWPIPTTEIQVSGLDQNPNY